MVSKREFEILSTVFSEEEIEELYSKLSEKKFNTLVFSTEWYELSEKKISARQKYMEKIKAHFIKYEPNVTLLFELLDIKDILELIPKLKPISSKLFFNFIAGLVLSGTATNRNDPIFEEVYRLTDPVWNKLDEYFFSDIMKTDMINKYIPKTDSILFEIIAGGMYSANVREILKDFVEDKPIFPGNKDQIKRLIVELTLKEKEKYQQIQNELSGNLLTGFACPLSPDSETVKEIYKIMTKDNQIAGKEVDFLNIFSRKPTEVEKPIKWLIRTPKGEINKSAIYVFFKIMLKKDTISRQILNQANHLFDAGVDEIFPQNKKYRKPKKEEEDNCIRDHFFHINQLIKNTPTRTI
jgi:hypothetical protein